MKARRIDVGGVRLHVQEEGEGEPLLLVHGLGTSGDLWLHQVPVLARHYRTLAVDLRGFGRSDKPREPGAYAVPVLARDIRTLIQALGLERLHLLGASMGGFIAQLVALDAPGLCRSLILCHTGQRMSIPAEIVASRVASLESSSMEDYGRLVAGQALAEGVSPALFDWLTRMIAANDKDAYRQVLVEGLRDFDVSERVAELALPTLVIVGAEDRVIPPEEGVALAGRIPGARLVTLEGVGHIGYAERPEPFNAAVLEFLPSLPAEG